MFQLGNKKHPNYPAEKMNDEMIEFLELCFEMDPKQRADANKLLSHPFVKVNPNHDFLSIIIITCLGNALS